MYLFNRQTTHDFISNKSLYVKTEIENLSNKDICNNSLEDLESYFYDKFKLDLIEIETDINHINYDVKETKIPKENSLYNMGLPVQSPFFYIDGYKIIYTIPFEGMSDLLYLKPSHFILYEFEVDNVNNPTDEKEGQIIFSQVYERSSIDSRENMMQFITKEFNSHFSSYIEMINYINIDIESFNSSLRSNIIKYLYKRLEKAEAYLKLREKLNIPLELSDSAPNTKPVRLKKIKKKVTSLPKTKNTPVEYGISDDDYNNIKNIINLSCISMEKAARTFYKLHEEELRDVILASLNTHYMGTSTGETFNKRGKTDIHIPFDNKSAYIGECKIWTGQGLFTDAINQLFSYMRWRDTKTSLIIFNKKNRDFSKILSTIDSILSNHDLCINKLRMSENEWQCDFKKNSESTEIVKINIVIYDLFIES